MTRPARPEDVDEICRGLPEAEVVAGDRPAYQVRGRKFVLHREPRRNAVDPATGEMYDDLLVIHTPTEADKLALVEDDRLPFFTVEHFNGYNAVLVQCSRLGEIDRDELAEILTDAWAARAPRTLVRKHLGDG